MSESAHIFERYVAGDQLAADELFYRYIERLTRLARSRLSAALARRVDAEDIVMSAYRSFFIGARDGQFAIDESGDLWALLVRITLNKLYRSAAHHGAQKRAMSNEASLPEQVAAVEPSITDALALADEVETVMRELSDNRRRMFELRLQGELIEDIADELGVNERTVRRGLKEVRDRLVQRAGLPTFWTEPKMQTPAPRPVPREFPSATLSYSDYVLEQQVGIGGMGRVYRATRKSDGETVAVKYLRKSFLSQPSVVERFAAEAEIVASLQHPNIVSVSGFGQTQAGGLFIAMDFVRGTDLTDHCDGSAHPKQIATWLSQVCDALQHAHQHGVIHCDLKPGNILVRDDGTALLTDFGLSRRTGDRVHAVAGTAPYMAPEQVDESLGSIDVRTDVYGVGAVLFHLCAGRPPFVGSRTGDVVAQVVTRDAPLVPSEFESRAKVFDEICRRCLCRQSDRFASIRLLKQALDSVL